ncbi:MAG: DoxX family protein [Bacillota bacterium]|nr:DoxX family protein [Bacillota bacterium]
MASYSKFSPLALRLVLGILFLIHGISKFQQMAGTEQFFTKLGLPHIAVPLIALVEIIGGISLIVGIGSRIFAAILALDMIVAIFIVKLGMGFVGGYEFELALAAGLVSLILSGPGALAINLKSSSSSAQKFEATAK